MEELQCPARCSKPGILNRKAQIQIFSTSRRGKTTKKQRCSWYTPSLKRKQGTHSISTCSSSKVFGGSLSATGNSSTPCHFQSQLYRKLYLIFRGRVLDLAQHQRKAWSLWNFRPQGLNFGKIVPRLRVEMMEMLTENVHHMKPVKLVIYNKFA